MGLPGMGFEPVLKPVSYTHLGQTFVLCSAAQRYCSSACREKAREQCKARQEAAKEKKKNAGKDLETVVAQAERLGMSYGKYRAMQAISAASIHAKTT